MADEAQSTILTPEEVAATTAEPTEEPQVEDVQLPSDTPDFEMPEKFQGKTPEEIAKAYVELEKLKADKAKEEKPSEAKPEGDKPTEDKPKTPEVISPEDLNKYIQEYRDNGGALTEETYKALEEKGLSKEEVDERIDYIKYKQEKQAKTILEPYGGIDEFKAATEWARENWTEEQVANANRQLASSDLGVVNAVLTGLFSAYNASKSTIPDLTLHTNQKPVVETKGYATKSDYLKDANDPRYDRDAAFRRKVEQKMAQTDLDNWY